MPSKRRRRSSRRRSKRSRSVKELKEALKAKEKEYADLQERAAADYKAKIKELKDALKAKEKEYVGLQERLNKQIQETQQTADAHKAKVQELRERLMAKEKERNSLRERLDKQIQQTQQADADHLAKIQDLRKQLDAAKLEATRVRGLLRDKEREAGDIQDLLNEQLEKANTTRDGNTAKVQELKERLKAAEREAAQLRDKLKAKEQECSQVQERLDKQIRQAADAARVYQAREQEHQDEMEKMIREIDDLEQSLQDKEKQVQNAQQAAGASQATIRKLVEQVKTTNDEVNRLAEALKVKQHELQEAQLAVAANRENQTKIQQLEDEMEVMDEELSRLTAALSAKEQELQRVQQAAEENQVTIQRFEEEIKATNDEVNRLKEALKTKDQELQEAETAAAAGRDADKTMIEGLQQKLKDSEEEVDQLLDQLMAREQELQEAQQAASTARHNQATITKLKEQLREADEEAKLLEEALDVKERELVAARDKEAKIQQLQDLLTATQEEIAELSGTVKAKEQELQEQARQAAATAAEYEDKLEKLRDTIRATDEDHEKAVAQLDAKEQEVAGLKSKLEAKEGEKKQLEESLHQLKQQAPADAVKIHELEEKVKAKEQDFNDLKQSLQVQTELADELKKKVQDKEAEQDRLQAQLDDQLAKQDKAAAEMSQLRQSYDWLEEKFKDKERQSAELQERLDKLNDQPPVVDEATAEEAAQLKERLANVARIVAALQRNVDKLIAKTPDSVNESFRRRMLGIQGLVRLLDGALKGGSVPEAELELRSPEEDKPPVPLDVLRDIQAAQLQDIKSNEDAMNALMTTVNNLVAQISAQMQDASVVRGEEAEKILEELDRIRATTDGWFHANRAVERNDEQIYDELDALRRAAQPSGKESESRTHGQSVRDPEEFGLIASDSETRHLTHALNVVESLIQNAFTPNFNNTVRVHLGQLRQMRDAAYPEGNARVLIENLIEFLEESLSKGIENDKPGFVERLEEYVKLLKGLIKLPQHKSDADQEFVAGVRAKIDGATETRDQQRQLIRDITQHNEKCSRNIDRQHPRTILHLVREFIKDNGGDRASWLTGRTEADAAVRNQLVQLVMRAISCPIADDFRAHLDDAIKQQQTRIPDLLSDTGLIDELAEDAATVVAAHKWLRKHGRRPAGVNDDKTDNLLHASVRRRESWLRAEYHINLGRLRHLDFAREKAQEFLNRHRASDRPRAHRLLAKALLHLHATRGEENHAETACFCTLLNHFFPGAVDACPPGTDKGQPPETPQCNCSCHTDGRHGRGHGHGTFGISRHRSWPVICRLLTAIVWFFMLIVIQPRNLFTTLLYILTTLSNLPQYLFQLVQYYWHKHVSSRLSTFRRRLGQAQHQDERPRPEPLHLAPRQRPQLSLPSPPPAATILFSILTFSLAYVGLTYLAVRAERNVWLAANTSWRHAYVFDLASSSAWSDSAGSSGSSIVSVGRRKRGMPYQTWSPAAADFRLLYEPIWVAFEEGFKYPHVRQFIPLTPEATMAYQHEDNFVLIEASPSEPQLELVILFNVIFP
ncbi:hypothetical protein VTJ49DRAFT_3789 [Mycothermus thermophilus]|uniref:Uncharacterized protein n=1 Tax=Humicola insolens TaxID=85995 RepID=A0ABR3V6M3_HUMIN